MKLHSNCQCGCNLLFLSRQAVGWQTEFLFPYLLFLKNRPKTILSSAEIILCCFSLFVFYVITILLIRRYICSFLSLVREIHSQCFTIFISFNPGIQTICCLTVIYPLREIVFIIFKNKFIIFIANQLKRFVFFGFPNGGNIHNVIA